MMAEFFPFNLSGFDSSIFHHTYWSKQIIYNIEILTYQNYFFRDAILAGDKFTQNLLISEDLSKYITNVDYYFKF